MILRSLAMNLLRGMIIKIGGLSLRSRHELYPLLFVGFLGLESFMSYRVLYIPIVFIHLVVGQYYV